MGEDEEAALAFQQELRMEYLEHRRQRKLDELAAMAEQAWERREKS